MSSFVEDHFNDYEIDFLENDFLSQNELSDCYLSAEALDIFLAPPQERWRDYLPAEHEAVITMDSAKDVQWSLSKAEIKHVRSRLMHLLGNENFEDASMKDITLFCIGPDSETGKFL